MRPYRGLAKRVFAVLAAVAACAAFVACGDDDSSDDRNSGSDGGSSASSAQVQQAAEKIKPLEEAPSPIPVSEPLEKIPVGEKFIFVQCGVPECAVLAERITQAAEAMGVEMEVIKAGGNASSIEQAFSSAAQKKPAAVIQAAIDPSLYPKALKQLEQQGTPVVAWTIPQPLGNGIEGLFNGFDRFADTGRLMADYVIAKSEGKANVVFFWPPEYTVFSGEARDFEDEIETLCPDCSVEVVKAPASTIGSSLPGRVVSYLQQNPDTDWVAMAFGSMVQGVPQAMATAGIGEDVQIISQAGGEPNWQYIKEGKQTVDLANGLDIESWLAMDMAARLATGQRIPKGSQGASTPQQFLTQDKINFDPADNWHPFPDYQDTFKKLWGVD